MRKLVNIAAGLGVAGSIGVAALGIGAGTADAAPPTPVGQAGFAESGPRLGPTRDRGGRDRRRPRHLHGATTTAGGTTTDRRLPLSERPLGFVQVCA